MQTKYETESKQKEIDNQKLTIEKQEIEYQRQRSLRNYLIVSSFLLFLLALFIFRGYRHKKLSNIYILEKNVALEQANEEIRTQKDEIESQRDMVFLQKEHIEKQQDKITQSIKNALLLQNAVLPSKNLFKDAFSDHFIVFKPKDIVSGDFYWITRIRQWLVFAVADCTGHGVPGALMTMLGLSFLKEIVAKKEIIQPSQILDLLRESIIDALQQKGNLGDQKDGIDIALCAFDTENNNLHFSGANMPLLIVTAQKELIRVSPTLQPVAIHFDMKPFTSQEIQLYPGDCIYLATDGYTDQFGGAKHKKLMGKNLRELLVRISQKPMAEQREILETTFTNWKGQNEQIDDVTVLGVKI
jgi:serine phosphatase RsbU (regulator of sigma subunit)